MEHKKANVKAWQIATIGLGIPAALYFLWDRVNYLAKKQEAFALAKSLTANKGILNAGAGPHKAFFAQTIARSPEIALNIDLVPDGMPRFIQLDLEKTPYYQFQTKQFDVVFASHMLEHLENWQQCLNELLRIADWVILVLPHPFSLGQLSPAHKQHFGFKDIERLRKIPNVLLYY